MKYAKNILAVGEFLYINLFFASNFAIIFPGDLIDPGFVIICAVLSLAHFILCMFLIKARVLSLRAAIILFFICMVFSSVYFMSGMQTLLKIFANHTFTVYDYNRLRPLALCSAEIIYRVVCVVKAAR